MKVSELIELLSKMDQDKDVSIRDPEWDSTVYVNNVEEEEYEVVFY
jgi:hypothetical protein